MGAINSAKARLRLHSEVTTTDGIASEVGSAGVVQQDPEKDDVYIGSSEIALPSRSLEDTVGGDGAVNVEATQAVWGKNGRYIVIAGIAMMMFIYELDNVSVDNYQNYATSSFQKFSFVASLNTAGGILFAVIKPPIAKLSDVIGRGETYVLTITCYILSYILCASASSINTYAAGYIFYVIGKSGTNIMNDIIISDMTSARWRGFAIGISFLPFLVMPWIGAFIVESVDTGVGWRWGIGMLAILMPFCASFIIIALLYFQRKARRLGIVTRKRITIYEFFSQIDLGGTFLFTTGFSMVLLPLTLASTSSDRWRSPWIDALITLGGVILLVLPIYEKYIARFPIIPIHYFKNLSIVTSVFLIATDSLGFSVTHAYLYAWATIAHNMSIRNATFYYYTNGVTQCLMGIIAGLIMMKTRKYKWLCMAGVIIRLVGYGVMVKLRGSRNSMAELFIVQLIQGFGSGIIQSIVLVSAQINVLHAQMAQITALVICASFLGSSIGGAIAGGIYTNTFKDALRRDLGSNASSATIDAVYNSITGVIPEWGTADRMALNDAYSDVLRFMTYTAIGSCVPSFILTFLMPNLTLPDYANNIIEQ